MRVSILVFIAGLAGCSQEAPTSTGVQDHPAPSSRRPNFLIIDVDTLSSSRVGTHRNGASITPALLAAFLWKRATRTGAVASILTGAVVTLLWKFGLDTSSWHPLLQEVTFPAAGLSIFALVAGSLVTPAPDRRLWEPFFARGGAPTT